MATKTRYAELGYEKQGVGLWRIIDQSSGSAVGPHYSSKAELLADLGRYAADFGCDAPPALALPTLPARGCVVVDEWAPVLAVSCAKGCGSFHRLEYAGPCAGAGSAGEAFASPKTGYSRRAAWRPVKAVAADLGRVMAEHLPGEWGACSGPAAWPDGRILCWPCVGGSEGNYFHIDVFRGRSNLHGADNYFSLITGKTLDEGADGWVVVARLAVACAWILGA